MWILWLMEGVPFHNQTIVILFLWNRYFIKFQPDLHFDFVLYHVVENITEEIVDRKYHLTSILQMRMIFSFHSWNRQKSTQLLVQILSKILTLSHRLQGDCSINGNSISQELATHSKYQTLYFNSGLQSLSIGVAQNMFFHSERIF